jgi:hypothetical protein
MNRLWVIPFGIITEVVALKMFYCGILEQFNSIYWGSKIILLLGRRFKLLTLFVLFEIYDSAGIIMEFAKFIYNGLL